MHTLLHTHRARPVVPQGLTPSHASALRSDRAAPSVPTVHQTPPVHSALSDLSDLSDLSELSDLSVLSARRAGALACALALTLALTACENPPSQQQSGTVIGGVLGGALGSQIGKGSGQTAATVIGTLIGATIGGNVGRSMDQTDRAKTAQALETVRTGRSSTWRNPDTGAEYTVTPTRTRQAAEGPCREYTVDATVAGRPERVHGQACRQKDGSWRAVP